MNRWHPAWWAFGGSLVLLAGLLFWMYALTAPATSTPTGAPLIVHCAAGIRAPMESIAAAYWHLHQQTRDAWTFEADLRPFREQW